MNVGYLLALNKKMRTVEIKQLILLFLIVLCNSSCEKLHKTGHFPDNVINFEDVNSEYDDYNSELNAIDLRYILNFSSNRNSSGNDFDIIPKEIFLIWHQETGKFEMTATSPHNIDYLNTVNTPCNELGPYSTPSLPEIFMFANDCNGDYDIKFLEKSGTDPTGIKFLNTSANELYPSFYGKELFHQDIWGYDVNKIEKILYCSDKEGDFNIYEVLLPQNQDIVEILKSDKMFESNKLGINSPAGDKCPFVNGKLLVFSSDRPGGYGGFDLYYSVYRNENWSEPVNFGEKINTQYDEYRPITLFMNDFDNNLLIFSSNRPGGKGGFDLYYTGIKQMIK